MGNEVHCIQEIIFLLIVIYFQIDARLQKDGSFSREVMRLDCIGIVWKNTAKLSEQADKNSDLCLLTVFIARRLDYLCKMNSSYITLVLA